MSSKQEKIMALWNWVYLRWNLRKRYCKGNNA
jgi:hypothetical protein